MCIDRPPLARWPIGTRCAHHEVVRQRARRKGHDVSVYNKLPPKGISHWFSQFATRIANIAGSHWAFLATFVFIVVWLISGPIFGFSDSWQLIANHGHDSYDGTHGLPHPEHAEP
jgi:hypothetical protein